jgi:hypothetical protein
MEVSVVGNLVLIDDFNVKTKVWKTGKKAVLWMYVTVSQLRIFEALSLCLCVTIPFESSCIRT